MDTSTIPTEHFARDLIRLRLSQILINEEYKAGKFKVPVHLAMGHEALAVAVSSVLKEQDKLVLSHRNIAYNLARLGKLRPILDEYLLEPTGLAGKRLGSMNLINPAKNIIYSSSILGNNFPVSAGIAMEEMLNGNKGVVFVLGGDGSMEEGSFYESLEIMKVHSLPIIVIIENNEWSLATKISERRHPIHINHLAEALGVTYHFLSGNDVELYSEKMAAIRSVALADGPQCVEVKLATLGDWRGPKTKENPEGKYINYHAGPTPSVDAVKYLSNPLLREDEEDPLYVIEQKIGRAAFEKFSADILKELQKELT